MIIFCNIYRFIIYFYLSLYCQKFYYLVYDYQLILYLKILDILQVHQNKL
jgi:hypothetical protein